MHGGKEYIMNNNPLVSIVVPIYNTEKFLDKCIGSIVNQTYKNLEIICVNDASPDNALSIIYEYEKKDNRIKVVTYEKNKGLFHARLAGADIATGQYICFVDSDDSISIDWIRLLVEKAIEQNADMVLGNMVQIINEKYCIENNYMSLCFERRILEKDKIFDVFMQDAGYNFAWHTIWNKIYSMELWRKARHEFEEMQGHLIMAEDVAYSAVLYYFSKVMAFSNHDAYFYYRNENASTSAATISLERIKKQIYDVIKVFNFFEKFLRKHDVYLRYEKKFLEFKKRNFRIQSDILYSRGLYDDKEYRDLLCNGFGMDNLELSHADDFYFYDIRTPYQNNEMFEENLKKEIVKAENQIISFDIFDTLLVRPFKSPAVIFEFFELKYNEFLKKNNIIKFKGKRIEAENICRRKCSLLNSLIEDCTLTEIYNTFSDIFSLPIDVTNKLKEFEMETEIEMCKARKYMVQLMNLAKHCGKRVILTSDIYYEKDFMISLLKKNNIVNYDELYVSSEMKKLKATGNLYKSVKSQYKKETILHIGDNWNSDVVVAKEQKINAMFVPKTMEIFQGIHYDNYTNDAMRERDVCVLSFADTKMVSKQINLNACQAICANKMFDKPFPSWNRELKYNGNAYFLGNYVFGTEMLGLSSWLLDIVKKEKYKKIVFLARDGYLPKIAFDLFVKSLGQTNIKTEYFYLSRRSLMPIAINESKNLLVIQDYMDIHQHNCKSILSLLDRFIFNKDDLIEELQNNYVLSSNCFKTILEFESVLKIISKYFDYDSCSIYANKLSCKMKQIFTEDTICFDLGYSGRIQLLINKAVQRSIDVCFLHSSGLESSLNAKNGNFKIYSYLNYTPKITSIIREYFFSELIPSCIGYEFIDDKLTPIFDEKEYSYIEHFIQEEIIRGMCDFIFDYCSMFSKYEFMFDFRSEEISLAFENFMNNIPFKDMGMFRCCTVEDSLYFNYECKSLYDIWNYNMRNRNNTNTNQGNSSYGENSNKLIMNTEEYKHLPKIKKALYCFIFDNKTFWMKLKNWFLLKNKRN